VALNWYKNHTYFNIILQEKNVLHFEKYRSYIQMSPCEGDGYSRSSLPSFKLTLFCTDFVLSSVYPQPCSSLKLCYERMSTQHEHGWGTWDMMPIINPLEHTAGCETGWAINAFAVNSSFLSVDGMTCFKAEESIYRMVYHTYRLYRFLGYKSILKSFFA
jgi:hypothetical protein